MGGGVEGPPVVAPVQPLAAPHNLEAPLAELSAEARQAQVASLAAAWGAAGSALLVVLVGGLVYARTRGLFEALEALAARVGAVSRRIGEARDRDVRSALEGAAQVAHQLQAGVGHTGTRLASALAQMEAAQAKQERLIKELEAVLAVARAGAVARPDTAHSGGASFAIPEPVAPVERPVGPTKLELLARDLAALFPSDGPPSDPVGRARRLLNERGLGARYAASPWGPDDLPVVALSDAGGAGPILLVPHRGFEEDGLRQYLEHAELGSSFDGWTTLRRPCVLDGHTHDVLQIGILS